MQLKQYFESFPRSCRRRIRQDLAAAHGVSEVTVRSWANGTRRHPCILEAIQLTEEITAGKVSRHDLRPEVFGPPGGGHHEQQRVAAGS